MFHRLVPSHGADVCDVTMHRSGSLRTHTHTHTQVSQMKMTTFEG